MVGFRGVLMEADGVFGGSQEITTGKEGGK